LRREEPVNPVMRSVVPMEARKMSRPLLPVNGFSSFFSDVGEGVEEEEEEELMDVMARPLTLDQQGEERENRDPVREVVRPVERE
jgi:hypothetical protein